MPTWVWVRDESTGHQFDVEASTLPRTGLTPVDGVDPIEGPGAQPRTAKPFVGKDGKPAVYRPEPPTDQQGEDKPPADTQNQEPTPADKPADTAKNRSTR